jgi:hypothetical protein
VAGGIDCVDHSGSTALHIAAREVRAPAVVELVSMLVGSGASVSAADARGATVLHALAERGDCVLDEGAGLLALLSAQPLPLNAQRQDGNTALHLAAFGGAELFARFLARQGAWVSLPNQDGLCALDTAQRCAYGMALSRALLLDITRPPNWVKDRTIHFCQLCKSPFGPSIDNPTMLPQRKHHCRHCGRCICASCSPSKLPIAKFGPAGQLERVCAECETIVRGGPAEAGRR